MSLGWQHVVYYATCYMGRCGGIAGSRQRMDAQRTTVDSKQHKQLPSPSPVGCHRFFMFFS